MSPHPRAAHALPRTRRRLACSLLALCLAGTPWLAQAHHAFAAEFDAEQPLQVKGKVTRLQIVNPHSWVYVDVKDEKGQVVNWGFEFAAPFALQERGLTRSTLPVGTEIVLNGFKAKNGKPFAYAATVTLPDGRTLRVGGAADSPPPAAPAGSAPR